MEDNDILELLEARQYHEASALLLERYQSKVFRLAFSIMHNEAHAEDVSQDVLVKIWKALPAYHRGASRAGKRRHGAVTPCTGGLRGRDILPGAAARPQRAVHQQYPQHPGGQ